MERQARGTDSGRGSLSDTVYRTIRDRIESGRAAPGSLLPTEDDLSSEFRVSRTVLREALTRLRHDGLIESRRGVGSRVLAVEGKTIFQAAPPQSIADLSACYEFRLGVEPNIAALAAERADAAAIRRIADVQTLLEREVATGELAAEHDLAFHAAIAAAAGNEYYVQTIAAIARPVAVGLAVASALTPGSRRERLTPTIVEHRAIMAAIEAHDADGARAAMLAHVSASRTRVFIGAN